MCVIDILFIVVDYNQWFRSQQPTGEYSINTIPRPISTKKRKKKIIINESDEFHVFIWNRWTVALYVPLVCFTQKKKILYIYFWWWWWWCFCLLAWFFSQSNANWIHLMKRSTKTTNNLNDPNSEKERSGFFFGFGFVVESQKWAKLKNSKVKGGHKQKKMIYFMSIISWS